MAPRRVSSGTLTTAPGLDYAGRVNSGEELGIFNDEGCLERGLYDMGEAENRMAEEYADDDESAHIAVMCACNVTDCECEKGSCECEDE